MALVCFSDTAIAQNGTLTLTANPTQLTFSAGTGTISPQTVTITSSAGTTNVSVAAISSNSWLQVTPSSGTTPLQVTVSVNPALATLSTDDGFININATGASVSVRAELDTLSGSSPLSANPNSLSFPFPINSTVSVTESVTLSRQRFQRDNFHRDTQDQRRRELAVGKSTIRQPRGRVASYRESHRAACRAWPV